MILLHLTCSSPAELFTSNRFQSPSFVCLQRQVSIASSRFLSMSLKLESELAKIDEIHDLRKIKDKRRARDRVIKMYEKTITDWTEQSIEQLNGIEIEKKIGEVTFSARFYFRSYIQRVAATRPDAVSMYAPLPVRSLSCHTCYRLHWFSILYYALASQWLPLHVLEECPVC